MIDIKRVLDDLAPFAGQWVAMRRGHVVLSDPDPEALVHRLRESGEQETVLRRVWGEDEPV